MLMTKRLLIPILTITLLFTVVMPLCATAPVDASAPIVEQVAEDEIGININNQWVTVTGAQGQTLEVISLTGRKLMTVRIDSPAQRIELNVPKGCYILKIGKVARKIAIH